MSIEFTSIVYIYNTFKMKISYSISPVLAILSYIVKACDFNMPFIMLSVQFTGEASLSLHNLLSS